MSAYHCQQCPEDYLHVGHDEQGDLIDFRIINDPNGFQTRRTSVLLTLDQIRAMIGKLEAIEGVMTDSDRYNKDFNPKEGLPL